MSPAARRALPGAGLALWAAGAGGLLLAGRHLDWSAGALVGAAGGWLAVLLVAARNPVRRLFGPVFAYELLRLGRRPRLFVLRGLYVGAVAVLLGWLYLSFWGGTDPVLRRSDLAQLAQFANSFFLTFEALQFAVVVLLTPAYVAPAITDEKERKTLDFLLATDLRDREIVFGKLAARVAALLLFVLAGLPILAFLQLFGGIDFDLLLAATATTLMTVVGLAALSIGMSVRFKRSGRAIAGTYLVAFLYAAGAPLLGAGVRELAATGFTTVTVRGVSADWSPAVDWLCSGNVGYLILRAGPGAVGAGTGWIADALIRYAVFWAVLTVALLAVAVTRLRSIALRQASGEVGGRRGRADKVLSRRPVVGDDPVFWREVFVEGTGGRWAGWRTALVLFLGAGLPPVVGLLACYGDLSEWLRRLFDLVPSAQSPAARWESFVGGMSGWVRFATGAGGGLALMAVALRGSGAVTGERDRDTWVSLVSTPLSAGEMLWAKWWGAVLAPRKLYAILILNWAVALLIGAVHPLMIPCTAVALAVYVAAFGWLGILCSVTARRTLAASVRAIAAGVFVGGGFWVAFGVCCAAPFTTIFTPDPVTREVAQSAVQLLAGGTPPFVLGWLPLPSFDERELDLFAWDRRNTGAFGPLAPVIGLGVWGGFAVLLALWCRHLFAEQTNRGPRLRPRRGPRA